MCDMGNPEVTRVDKRENNTPLTEEQKKFGEANHRLAFSILQKYVKFIDIVGWDEAVSATGIAFCRVLRAYKPEMKRKLSASLNRAIYRELRQQARKKQRQDDGVGSLGDDDQQPDSRGQDQNDARVTAAEVEKAVGRLPEREKKVLTLFYGLGGAERTNFRQIGALMGFTGTTAKKIHDKALTQLRTFKCT